MEEFPAVTAEDIKLVLEKIGDSMTTVMFHAETDHGACKLDSECSKGPAEHDPNSHRNEYSSFLASRPSISECCAIKEVLSLAHLAPELPLHIVHLSAMEAIPLLREARAKGVNITAETCFHYLSLIAEDVKNGDTRYKCCPPVRAESNKDALWSELRRSDSVINTLVSDHSPCTPNLKLLSPNIPQGLDALHMAQPAENEGDFFAAWGGISSVGLGLSILWTEATSSPSRNLAIEDIVRLCCANTARQVGLEKQKGDLGVGFDGDLCVFDDEAEFIVEHDSMLFRNKCSPYQGKKLRGVVRETWVRGQKVFERGRGFDGFEGAKPPSGRCLLEPRTTRTKVQV